MKADKLIGATLVTTGLIVGTGIVDGLFFAPRAHADNWCNDGTYDPYGACIAHAGILGTPYVPPCGLIQLAMNDPCWGVPDPPAPQVFTAQQLSQDSSAQLSNAIQRQIVVSCPVDLPMLVGQTERCTFDDQGRRWWLDASVVPDGPGTVRTHYQVQPEWTA